MKTNLQKIKENGQLISPVLKDGMKNFMIDIDGTICEDIPNEEPERMIDAKIYPNTLETINQWFDEGHIITFFTSRLEEHREVTEKWLNKHGFKYHGMLMGKPRGGNYHWIDNHTVRATKYKGTFSELETVQAEVQVFKEEN